MTAGTTDDTIVVARDGEIATVDAEPPGQAQRADEGDVARPRRDDHGSAGDASLRCIIVRGAGEQGVLAGQRHRRIRDASARTPRRRASTARSCTAPARALADCRHPLVAQIHGICVGGGLEIAALCDLRICGASSRFGAPIKNLGPRDGVCGDGAARARWSGRTSRSRSCSKGASSTRAEAKEKGLVTRVVADEQWRPRQRTPRRGASPTARRSLRAGTRSSRAVSPIPRPISHAEARRVLRLLRHRGFPHRLRGVPREAQARVHRAMTRAGDAGAHAHPGPLAGMRVLELAQIMAGPDVRHAARRHGRRRGQGREAARRRRLARLPRAARERRVGAVHDAEPQQARDRARISSIRPAATCCCEWCATRTC